MRAKLFYILISITSITFGQNRGNIWCFGDSAGIDFTNLSNPLPIHSAEKTRGSCASISDSLGNLLFYSGYNDQGMWGGDPDRNGEVYNRDHVRMLNGDLIITELWYQEQVIIPDPGNSDKYYLFSLNVTGGLGFYYSVIDMTQDTGRGKVILKNVQLQNYYADDCVQAIKHGNGRDWWIITRQSNTATDEFYEYLITPLGISAVNTIHVGSSTSNNIYHFTFSKLGNKIIAVDARGLIEIFDFDRCTGVISLDETISNEVSSGDIPYYISAAFSPNQRYIYISCWPDPANTNYLFQFDLQAANIFNSIDTLWSLSHPIGSSGFLKLAPDNKIYMGFGWQDEATFNYPYPDTLYNAMNNNLSVINYPDSAGIACDFQPFSFNLGAGRCYYGLPNNPDYEMPSIAPCDSLTGIEQLAGLNNSELFVYYHSGWQIAFINAKELRGKNYSLSVYDLMGKEVYREEGKANRYFTVDLNCAEFASGMYIVRLQTEKEKLVKRFVKE
jgi:hypothetical protein